MAAITKSGAPSLATPQPARESTTNGYAAGPIAAGDACYVSGDAGNGMAQVTRATGAAARTGNPNDPAIVEGFAAGDASLGDPVTLYRNNVHMHYGAGLAVGTPLYLSGTVPGGLDTAPSLGGTVSIAKAITTSVIRCIGDW